MIEYPLWLQPPDQEPDEERDIPTLRALVQEKLPVIRRKHPGIPVKLSQFPSGLPQIEIILRVSSREDSPQVLEAVFGIARELGGWEIYDEQSSWTIADDEEGRQALAAEIEWELRQANRRRLKARLSLAFSVILAGIGVIFFFALTGDLNQPQFVTGAVLGSIVLTGFGVFARRRLRSDARSMRIDPKR